MRRRKKFEIFQGFSDPPLFLKIGFSEMDYHLIGRYNRCFRYKCLRFRVNLTLFS